jgi:hypothetical protein
MASIPTSSSDGAKLLLQNLMGPIECMLLFLSLRLKKYKSVIEATIKNSKSNIISR